MRVYVSVYTRMCVGPKGPSMHVECAVTDSRRKGRQECLSFDQLVASIDRLLDRLIFFFPSRGSDQSQAA
jgi:hypothetical protein